MTQIDFYQLNPERHRADWVICQLCQKAFDKQKKTLVLTQNHDQSTHLDLQLWVFSDDSFIPHDTEQSDDFDTPILIQDSAPQDCERPLLINLCDYIPDNFAQYQHIIELVTEDNKQQTRSHYRFYRERGYPLRHHKL